MKAVVYSRVSTDGQERDGTSLDTQERATVECAKSRGWAVVECIRDTASGFTLDRPGIERVRNLVRQGVVNVVVAYAVDRLSRNQNHIGVLFDEVQQAGATLEFVTEKFEDTAIGRFILAARAFIAEVEREKIVERTTRGKAERARSGRIPQGTGKGCYGYMYNRGTGRREVAAFQATVVRRIFERYAAARSFSAVANELNEAGIPAFDGGQWYPLTIRRILTNEAYTGRLVYRRTRRIKLARTPGTKAKSRVVEQAQNEWIEVEGACPRIVDAVLWDRVQTIISDPERLLRKPKGRLYLLRGRARCGVCGAAMVGQTLTVKGHPYQYYRCRHAYANNTSYQCPSRYVSGVTLESALWQEVKKLLSDPDTVLNELLQGQKNGGDEAEVTRLETELAAVAEREKRLVRLYTLGHVTEDAIRDESARVARERALLQERLTTLKKPAILKVQKPNVDQLKAACRFVAEWLERASDGDRMLALEALQIVVTATRKEATITGVLPPAPPACLSATNGDAHVRSVAGGLSIELGKGRAPSKGPGLWCSGQRQ